MDKLDTITINLADLSRLVREMEEDNIATVTITITPPDEYDGESSPACIQFEGATAAEPMHGICYDEIESIE